MSINGQSQNEIYGPFIKIAVITILGKDQKYTDYIKGCYFCVG